MPFFWIAVCSFTVVNCVWTTDILLMGNSLEEPQQVRLPVNSLQSVRDLCIFKWHFIDKSCTIPSLTFPPFLSLINYQQVNSYTLLPVKETVLGVQAHVWKFINCRKNILSHLYLALLFMFKKFCKIKGCWGEWAAKIFTLIV